MSPGYVTAALATYAIAAKGTANSRPHCGVEQEPMRGVALKVIQELLGHASILMTMRYAHLAPQISRDAVRLLDRLGSVRAASRKAA